MKVEAPPRRYRQAARADAAAATAQRIGAAFSDCMRAGWFDEITLEDVAERAGVTVRTVIRRFGGKEGLLQDFVENFVLRADRQRAAKPGDVAGAIAGLLDLYEEWGDSVIRNLAEESRHPALKPLLDDGRRRHRAMTEAAYAPQLERLPEGKRRQALDALVAATDVYLWKLLRRDLHRSRSEVESTMRMLVDALLAEGAAVPGPKGRRT